jgi:two-component system alkaline phosphatase synthesis response regulator PhoP
LKLFKVLILAEETGRIKELGVELAEAGLVCGFGATLDEASERLTELAPDLMLVLFDDMASALKVLAITKSLRQKKSLPAIALVSQETLSLDFDRSIDDFVVEPWGLNEVLARAKRVVKRDYDLADSEIIRCGDLLIDLRKCEVSVSGRLVSLTFKEYELLKFLASNRGRVFSREALLNGVWGYDYYGGDRTVDVSIRRLRSKIEDATHSFIRTVRNIGYCFREDV